MCIKYMYITFACYYCFLSTIFDLITYLDACPEENGSSLS